MRHSFSPGAIFIQTRNFRSVIYYPLPGRKNFNDQCDLDFWPGNGAQHIIPSWVLFMPHVNTIHENILINSRYLSCRVCRISTFTIDTCRTWKAKIKELISNCRSFPAHCAPCAVALCYVTPPVVLWALSTSAVNQVIFHKCHGSVYAWLVGMEVGKKD